ncbi:hypothetical protein D030_4167A, partial [Vibrio parahaemolyticus AQ3810]
MRCIELTRCA